MKKRFLFVIVAAIVAVVSAAWYLAIEKKTPMMKLNRAETVEDTVYDVYGTDVAVTVDGRAVQAYEIGGRTVIAVEDLEYCGFTVDEEEDKLNIVTYYLESYEPPEIVFEKNLKPIGQTEIDTTEVRINNVPIKTNVYEGKHYADVDELGSLTDDYNKEKGWSDYNFNTIHTDDTHIDIQCFRFPRINVPAMLEDMTPMVNQAELELYTEWEPKESLGALYEPEKGLIAGINADGNGDWAHFKKKVFKNPFSAYSNYVEFDTGQLDIYKINKRAIGNNDVLMLVPWNTGDVMLAAQNEEYIRKFLSRLKKYNRPVIIRYGAEMNVSSIGNSPTAYVKAFRYVADIVHEYGFAVMWSVNDLSALNKPYELYYPGDEYVDWVGVSIYPTHDFMHTSPTSETDAILFGCSDYGWHTNNIKYIERFMSENDINKPLAISEGAVEARLFYDGAPADIQDWAEVRLRNMYWYLPMRCPNLKMITYFSVDAGGSLGGSNLEDNEGYINIIDEALAAGMYKPSYSENSRFSFTELNGTEFESNEKVPIYAYVYLPKEDTVSVTYMLDGEAFDTQCQIPYMTSFDVSGLTDGVHTLTVNIEGENKNYTMEYEINVDVNAAITRIQ